VDETQHSCETQDGDRLPGCTAQCLVPVNGYGV
jgi:hypothetical protein